MGLGSHGYHHPRKRQTRRLHPRGGGGWDHCLGSKGSGGNALPQGQLKVHLIPSMDFGN